MKGLDKQDDWSENVESWKTEKVEKLSLSPLFLTVVALLVLLFFLGYALKSSIN